MARNRKHTRRSQRLNPRGILVARSGGFGFVQTAEGEYFVPASAMGGAFDGDLVELAPLSSRGRKKNGQPVSRTEERPGDKPAARVVRVIDRAHDTLIGRYEIADPFGVVVPEDHRIPYDIFTLRADYPDIPDGSLVKVRIMAFPTRKSAATGVIEEVIGDADDQTLGVDVIVARHKLETAFSEGALAEASAASLDADGALHAGYRDITDRWTCTIDPADAKDFDDALSIDLLEEKDHMWRVGVHIADVSHYVPWNSSIDLDARRRATSVYLVDRVIPMIPPALSDDLCSLMPGEIRRTMTVDLYLDDAGQLRGYDIYPALIRSRKRYTYDEVQELLESAETPSSLGELAKGFPEAGAADSAACLHRLRALSSLAQLRQRAREKAGGIDFSTTEAKVQLDEEGKPLAIELRTKTPATQLVEEAMIFANEVVATHLGQRKFPCLYRVHEQPSADSLLALVPVFQEFPWFTEALSDRLPSGDPHVIQAILEACEGRPEEELITSLLLRSMKRAVYRPSNDGHYGLASNAYCHFTSPIRRYPDLVVHRMLRASLTKRPEKFDQEVAALPWIAEHSSDMERVAEACARESQELKMIEYLQAFIGTTFSAIVSGVMTYGLFVRLENTAEGFIPTKELGREYFGFDPVRYTLTGTDTGRRYRLGQRLAVTLIAADPREGHLDFKLAASS